MVVVRVFFWDEFISEDIVIYIGLLIELIVIVLLLLKMECSVIAISGLFGQPLPPCQVFITAQNMTEIDDALRIDGILHLVINVVFIDGLAGNGKC